MEIQDLTAEQAEEIFFSEKGQQVWAMTVQIGGSPLERAFVGDYVARLLVGSAFVSIMIRRDKNLAAEALDLIKKSSITNFDRAVWAFFTGAYYEMLGDQEQMASYYKMTIENDPGYYTAYLRIAKKAYTAADYCTAESFYLGGISCFDQGELNEREKAILATCYAELAGCLLMMHRYNESKAALEKSYQIKPMYPERASVEALLFAVNGDKKRVKECISELKQNVPMAYKHTKKSAEQILRKKNPHFFVLETEEDESRPFWEWFSSCDQELAIAGEDSVASALQMRLGNLFPFVERVPKVRVELDEGKGKITFCDGFTRSLTQGYQKLIEACPAEILEHWEFGIDRFYKQVEDFNYTIQIVSGRVEAEKNSPEKEIEEPETMEHIWEMEDPADFVIALSQYIGEKCQYGEDMSVLSEPERIFYVGQILEMEVNNGGFSQFFFNSSGDFANEIVSAFTKIGAVKTAEICKRAVSIYDGEVPADRDEREDVFVGDEELGAVLDECDDAFFAYEEDLNALYYQYVLKNREAFT